MRIGMLLAATGTVVATVAATGVAVATSGADLRAGGETSVSGTDGDAVFRIGDRTVHQVRYVDGARLGYTFTLENDGLLPVTVTGLAVPDPQPRLLKYDDVVDEDDESRFTIGPKSSRQVTVEFLMEGCETLSARAGSYVTGVDLELESGGLERDTTTVTFPEEVRTGSAREARCVNSTATSRPPG